MQDSLQRPVSVVIPTYNGRSLLEKHLPAVVNCLRDKDEVVIVDDASTDGTLSWLAEAFQLQSATVRPEVHHLSHAYKPQVNSLQLKVWFGRIETRTQKIRLVVVGNTRNLRFAANANLGVALASHPLVFLVNNDVSPEASVLKHLIPHFADEGVFGVGCLEYKNEAEHHAGSSQKAGKNKLWFEKGLFIHNRADDFETGQTAWVSGGSGLFDRHKWLELHGFDVGFYPAYGEDIDLSFRARKKGWKVLFDAQAVVYHDHETTNEQVFGQSQLQKASWRNSLKFTWKHATLAQKVLFLMWLPYWGAKYWWWQWRQVS